MKILIRNLASFILPVLVTVIIPILIEKHIAIFSLAAFIAGLIIINVGLIILVTCIANFIRIGKGTLAPWSPTQKLVIRGLYRYVRNPMITGVWIILLGEALSILSFNIMIWAIIFFIINTIHLRFVEEPDLERKFGDEYKAYKKVVHRWIPRLSPYKND